MKNPQTTKEPKLTEEQESKKRFFERYVWVDGRKRRPDFGDWLTIETGEEMWEFIANEIALAEKRVVDKLVSKSMIFKLWENLDELMEGDGGVQDCAYILHFIASQLIKKDNDK